MKYRWDKEIPAKVHSYCQAINNFSYWIGIKVGENTKDYHIKEELAYQTFQITGEAQI